jgi:hypothetical protein
VAARCKAITVFSRSNTKVVALSPTRGRDVYVCKFCLYCPVCRYRPCVWLIPHPRRPTDCVQNQETEKNSQGPTVGCRAFDDDDDDNDNNNNNNKLNQLTHELCRTEHFSTGHQLCSHSTDSQHFMEPEGSLQHSQELSTCPYPELDQSSQTYFTLPL